MSYNRRSRGGTPRSNNQYRGFNDSGRNRGRGGRGGRNNATFDPTHLIQQQTNTSYPVEIKEYQVTNMFADFGLTPALNEAILAKGYEKPTPIQDMAIPHILNQKDVIGLASTGTGKTAAFLLPLIHDVVTNQDKRVLIVAPTRELAVQIKNELHSFTQSMGIYSALCIGGTPLHRQAKILSRRPQFVIGTPGRIIDLEKRKHLFFADFTNIVLDEVDRMLDMGFMPDVKYIIGRLPNEKQALFFSATMPMKLRSLVPAFMKNPVTVEIERQETASSVKQEIVTVGDKSKVTILHDLLIQVEFEKVLVFGRTKHGLNQLARLLSDRGFSIATIHGNKSQSQRQRALQLFRDDKVKVLLATDVASRGLDIDNVTHVINYDLPQTKEDYIHRIGRTGRANASGVAVSLV